MFTHMPINIMLRCAVAGVPGPPGSAFGYGPDLNS